MAIDSDFITGIRLNQNTINWIFDDSETADRIVQKDLTHNSLLDRYSIEESILNFYFNPTKLCLSIEEFNELKKERPYAGENILKPYSLIIRGAYHSRREIVTKLQDLTLNRKITILCSGKKVEDFEDLLPYFNDYTKGFKQGFENFKADCIDNPLSLNNTTEGLENAIFEFITKKHAFSRSWRNNHQGFKVRAGFKISGALDDKQEIIGGIDDGKHQGRFYKAWSYVFSNSKEFAPMFEKIDTAASHRIATSVNPKDENALLDTDFIVESVKDYLYEIKEYFCEDHFNRLNKEIVMLVKTGTASEDKTDIIVLKRVNKKKIGWAIKSAFIESKYILESLNNDSQTEITIELLEFVKSRVSIFKNDRLDRDNYRQSQLYKNLTEKVE